MRTRSRQRLRFENGLGRDVCESDGMSWLWMSFSHALVMLWETFWALVLGFGFSAALQVFVSKEQMTRAFGRAGLREVALATGLGAASSSCSYAAAAAGRSAFQKGAALVPMLAFMFASTNLVVELGAVLWLLMGWRFVLAEILGAFVLIGVMWLLVKLIFPKEVEEEARTNANAVSGGDDCCHGGGGDHEHKHEHAEEKRGKMKRMADAFIMDWQMLWKEILGGFLIAGFLMAVVPSNWWQALFLRDVAEPLRIVENAMVGPLIAVASFVCSIGNIPLASLLWSNGISFGGVISFIYADLIVIPLILIYAKYYGARAAAYITLVFYLSMVIAGIVVDLLFAAAGLIPTGPRPESAVAHAMIRLNYTTWLDAIALGFFVWLFYLHATKSASRS
jgi:uncharacterized membrane protein YraQ (UPF0718 family)